MLTSITNCARAVLVIYLSLGLLPGCATVHIEVRDPVSPIQFPAPVMARITPTVVVPPSEFKADGKAGVNFMHNPQKFQQSLEGSIESALKASGIANEVLIRPAADSWTLVMTGKWDSRSTWYQYTWKVIQVTFTVMLLFIPFFFISESFTIQTGAEIALIDPSGIERGRSSVQSKLDIDIAPRKFSKEVLDGMFTLSSDELANRILLEIKRHPHWLDPTR